MTKNHESAIAYMLFQALVLFLSLIISISALAQDEPTGTEIVETSGYLEISTGQDAPLTLLSSMLDQHQSMTSILIETNSDTDSISQGYTHLADAGDYRVFFDDFADAPIKIVAGDFWVSFRAVGAQENNRGDFSGNKARFVENWPSASAEYSVEPGMLKEEIILASRESGNTFTYEIKSQGVTARLQEDGSVSFIDSASNEIFEIPPPFAFDSSEGIQEAGDVKANLRESSGVLYLDLVVDSEWLNDPSRVFPVIIDPTMTLPISGRDDNGTTKYFEVTFPQPINWTCSIYGHSYLLGKHKGEFKIWDPNGNRLVYRYKNGKGSVTYTNNPSISATIDQLGKWKVWIGGECKYAGGSGSVTWYYLERPIIKQITPDGQKFYSSTATVEWDLDYGQSQVQFSRSQDFSSFSTSSGGVEKWVTGKEVEVALPAGTWYWRVRSEGPLDANDKQAWSNWSEPRSLIMTQVVDCIPAEGRWEGSSSPTLTWKYTGTSPKTTYQVQVSKDEAFTQLIEDRIVSTDIQPNEVIRHVTSGSLEDGEWYWRVRVGPTWSDWSLTNHFRVDGTAPIPGTIDWKALKNGVNLWWEPFSEGLGSGIKNYEVYRDDTLIATILADGILQCGISGLTDNQSVSFMVVAVDNVGNCSEVAVQAAAAAAETKIISPIETFGNLAEGYSALVNIESLPAELANGYQVQRISSDGNSTLSPWLTEPKFIDSGLAAHEEYSYSVRTKNSVDRFLDQFTGSVSVIVKNNAPLAPVLQWPIDGAYVNGTSIELSAEPALDPDGDVLQYQICYRRALDTQWVMTPWSNLPSAQVSVTEGTYEWKILVDDGYLGEAPKVESVVSQFTVDTTPSTASFAISGNHLYTSSSGKVYSSSPDISLTDITAADVGGEVVKVRFRTTDISGQTAWAEYDYVSQMVLNWSLPTGDGQKTIEIQAQDSAGNWGTSFSRQITLDRTGPSIPQIASVRGKQGAIELVWSYALDLGAGVSGCAVEYQLAAETEWTNLDSGETTALLTGLGDNQAAILRICAEDYLGNRSEWSLPVEGCSLAATTVAAVIPRFNNNDGHYIEFEIDPVLADAYSIIPVDVKAGQDSSEMITELDGVDFSDFGLSAHSVYKYRVITYNKQGESSVGQELTAETINNIPIISGGSPLTPSGFINTSTVTLPNDFAGDMDGDSLSYTYFVTDSVENQVNPDTSERTISSLVDGETYSWYAVVSDGFGGEVTSTPTSFTIDTTPPTVTLSNMSTEWATAHSVVISSSDLTSGVKAIDYRWNTDAFTEVASSTLSLQAPQGQNVLSVKAVDYAGNESEYFAHAYKVDSTAPLLDFIDVSGFTSEAEDLYITSNDELFANWQMSDAETGIASYKWAVATGPNGLLAFSPGGAMSRDTYFRDLMNHNLDDGTEYYLVIEAVNPLGLSARATSEQFTVDSSAPIIKNLQLVGATLVDGVIATDDLSQIGLTAEVKDIHSGIAIIEYAVLTSPGVDLDTIWASSVQSLDLANQPGGQTYYFALRAFNNAGLSSIAISSGVLLDDTPPQIVSLVDEGAVKRDNTALLFSVHAIDGESGLANYRYAVGRTEGGTEISSGVPGNENGWVTVRATSPSMDIPITGLDLADDTYYITVEAVNGVGKVTRAVTDGITIDSTLPAVPSVSDDGIFTSDGDELHARWTYPDSESVSHYLYRVLCRTSPGATLSPLFDWREKAATGDTEELIVNTNGSEAPGLVQGSTYFSEVKAIHADGSESGSGLSNGITVDTTPPEGLTVNAGAYASRDNWVVSWSAADPESGLVGFKYAVGTTRGGSDLTNGFIAVGQASKVTIPGDKLIEGGIHYITVSVMNGAGSESTISSEGVVIDSTPPPIPQVIDEGSYTNQDDCLNAWWTWTVSDPESATRGFEYAIVPERILTDETTWVSIGSEKKIAAEGLDLINGQAYFIAVRATNGTGLTSVGFSDGIVVDVTAPDPPHVDDLVDYSISKSQLSAVFSAVDLQSGIMNYRFSVGTFNEPEAIWPLTELTETRVDLTDLTLEDGEIYYFYVQSVNNVGLISATAMSDGVMVDSGYPLIGVVVDDGEYSRSASELAVHWNATSSASGIAAYEHAITTDPNAVPTNWQINTENPVLSSATITGLELVDGSTYYVIVRGQSVAGKYTAPDKWGKSDGITVDTSPPVITVIADSGAFTSDILKVHWEAQDIHSGLSGYQYAVGTTRGGWDVTDGWLSYSTTGEQVDATITSLPLVHGQNYYVMVKAQNGAGGWSEPKKTDGFSADLTPPTTPIVAYSSSYVNSLTTLLGITWQSNDSQTGISAYRYGLTTEPDLPSFGEEIPYAEAQGTLNLTELNLLEGATYYLALQTKNGVGVWSESGISVGITADTIPPVVTFATEEEELVTNTGSLEIPWSTTEGGQMLATLVRVDGSTVQTEEPVSAGANACTVLETQEGQYLLQIQVTDLAGNPSVLAEQGFRLNAKPRVNAGLDITVRKGEPFAINVEAADPDGQVVALSWDFGDGSPPSEESQPTHSFTEVGKYIVTITATDNDEGIGTDTVEVTVTNTSAGMLFVNETWDSPMLITGEVIVPAGITLTIPAGAQITFAQGTELLVLGQLLITGEVGNPATLSGVSHQVGFWKGINLNRSAGAISVTGAIISDAARGLAVVESSVAVVNATFRGNQIGVHAYAAAPSIDASEFVDNSIYGIKEDAGANPLVTNSKFSGNQAGPYYDEVETIISVDRLNSMGSNAGNFEGGSADA